ncbi:MAG: hypothetical protein MAG451_00726 [Anaerolineales bacterium]|nr:hypothetical protein [Anaerolineales bacterium]
MWLFELLRGEGSHAPQYVGKTARYFAYFVQHAEVDHTIPQRAVDVYSHQMFTIIKRNCSGDRPPHPHLFRSILVQVHSA